MLEIDGRSTATVGEIEAACQALQRRFERQGTTSAWSSSTTSSKSGPRTDTAASASTSWRDHLWPARHGQALADLRRAPRPAQPRRRGRDDKRPTLADLRESGDIENDADVVMMLYQEAYYLKREMRAAEPDELAALQRRLSDCENKLEITIPKNRNGEGEQTIHVFCDIGRSAVRPLARS